MPDQRVVALRTDKTVLFGKTMKKALDTVRGPNQSGDRNQAENPQHG
jgi:hypothetical protein